MKRLFIILFLLGTLNGCQQARTAPSLLWQGGTIPIGEVTTPVGFTITPTEAVSTGIERLGPSKQRPILFADDSAYYFGYGTREKALKASIPIDGKLETEP